MQKPQQIIQIEKILGFELNETENRDDILNFWNESILYFLNEKQEVVGLNVCMCELQNIDFLQALPNLTHLNFIDNQVSDISILQHLTNLETLWFSNNQVSDISVLQHLTNLVNLDFRGNQISDITTLQYLNDLRELWFDNNQVSNISVLQYLINLTSLNFGNNQISDISVLQHLINLTKLNFTNNQVSNISVLQHLPNLTDLSFGNNQISNITALQHLTNLTKLYFWQNKVTKISALQLLKKLTNLNFGGNQISDISVLRYLSRLDTLSFWENQVSDISILEYLPNLTELYFGSNAVSDISVLRHLAKLIRLWFPNNQVSDISVLQHLPNLTNVDASDNKVVLFPEFLLNTDLAIKWDDDFYLLKGGINLYGNPISDVPIEVIKEGKEAIRRFLEEKKGKPLYEAKLLIVGEGEAGKTSLAEKLMNRGYVLTTQPTTHGLAIRKWQFPHKEQTYTANIWDFGGQEIYRNTHRFFLTRNSLYILLTDNRKEDTDFNYWLEKIKLLGGNSPVLIVQNEKDKRKKELPDFQFSNIRGVFQVDLADNSGLDKLEEAIKTHFSALETMQRPFPVDWLAVRQALECKTQAHISLEKYQEICEQHNVPEKLRQQDLGQYLHDLGVLLYYKEDDFLQHKIFLQPTWVTKAVYELIDFMNKGQFSAQDAKNLWEQPKYEGSYEKMHLFLLKIIEKFELCYQQNEMYVMPQLLSAKAPAYDWNFAHNLQVQFDYSFPLHGIFWRLIVRLHTWIGEDNIVWKEGVIFAPKHYTPDTKAFVTETYKNKVPTITIRVVGLQRKDLLAVISNEIQTINSYYNFDETQQPVLKVPCNCEVCSPSEKPELYKYNTLIKYLNNKVYEIRCEESFKFVPIRPLLDDVLLGYNFLEYEVKVIRRDKEMSFLRFGMSSKFDSFEETTYRVAASHPIGNSFEEIENHNFMTKQELLSLIDEDQLGAVFSELNNYHFGANQATYSQLRTRFVDGEKNSIFKQNVVVFINSHFDKATRKTDAKPVPLPQGEKPKENKVEEKPKEEKLKVDKNNIFISYCSADRNLRQIMELRLKIYLKSTKNKFGEVWTDKEIAIGDDWNETIQDALEGSSIGILLVSPMFLGSHYCMADELKKMLDKRKNEGYLIVPILLRECSFFNDENLKAMQFFKTYQSEYDFADLLRKDKLMPFDELAEVPAPQERLLNRYFQKLANDIDAAVTKQLAKNK